MMAVISMDILIWGTKFNTVICQINARMDGFLGGHCFSIPVSDIMMVAWQEFTFWQMPWLKLIFEKRKLSIYNTCCNSNESWKHDLSAISTIHKAKKTSCHWQEQPMEVIPPFTADGFLTYHRHCPSQMLQNASVVGFVSSFANKRSPDMRFGGPTLQYILVLSLTRHHRLLGTPLHPPSSR